MKFSSLNFIGIHFKPKRFEGKCSEMMFLVMLLGPLWSRICLHLFDHKMLQHCMSVILFSIISKFTLACLQVETQIYNFLNCIDWMVIFSWWSLDSMIISLFKGYTSLITCKTNIYSLFSRHISTLIQAEEIQALRL